jgi:hypothetical protein
LQGDEQSCAKGQSQQQQPDMMMRSQGNNNVNQHNGQPPSTAATTVKSQEPSRHEIRPGRDGMSPVTAQWTALQPSAVSRGFSDPSLAVVQPASNNNSNGSVGCSGSSELFHSHHYHSRRQRQQQSVNSNCNSRSSSAADLSLQSSTVNLSSLGNQHGSASSSLNNVNHIKVS